MGDLIYGKYTLPVNGKCYLGVGFGSTPIFMDRGRSIVKKIYFSAWIICVIIILCGCGKVKFSDAKNYNMYQKQEEVIAVPKDLDARIDCLGAKSEKMIYSYSTITGAENTVFSEYFIYDFESRETRGIPFDQVTGMETIRAFSFDKSGNIFLGDDKGMLYVMDQDGNILKKVDVLEVMAQINPQASFGEEVYIFSITSDEDYVYVLLDADDSYLLIMDSELNGKLMQAGWWSFLYGERGQLLLGDSFKECTFAYQEKDNTLVKKGDFEEELQSAYLTTGDNGYDYFYYNYDAFSAPTDSFSNFIGVKKGKRIKIFDFDTMGIMQDKICENGVISDGQGGYRMITVSTDGKNLTIEHLMEDTKINNYSLKTNRKVLRIGGLNFPRTMQYLVRDFNADSDEYYVEIVNYAEQYGDYDDGLTHLNLDLVSGETLDGFSLYGLDYQSLAQKGVLQDLNDYFDHSAFPREAFSESFLKNITKEDGKIYFLYPYYVVSGYAYSEDISFDDLSQYEALVSRDSYFLADFNHTLFGNLLRYSGKRYVDLEKEELHINEQSFRSLLELMKKQKEVNVEVEDVKLLYCKGEAKALKAEFLYPIWYFYYKDLCDGDLKISMPGVDGTIVDPQTYMMGVDARTENKEGIYQFIDYILSPEIYRSYFYYEGFPVMNSMWESWKTQILATDTYTDILGNVHPAHEISLGIDEAQRVFKVGSVTEEEFDQMRKEMEKAVWLEPLPDKYINVILDEANGYFEGQKDLDETCRILEERLKNAMWE